MKKLLGAVIVLVVLCLAGLAAAALWPGAPLRRDDGNIVSSQPDTDAPQEAALGEFTPLDRPRPAPALGFTTRDGRRLHLADFRGRFVLVNFWATWCGPCVEEMPSLDRLQARLGNRLTILAISEDRSGGEVVDPFLAKLGLARLPVYLDPKMAAQEAFAIRGLPTTFLVDPQGRILGLLEGAAPWDSPAMMTLLQHYLDRGGAPTTIKASTR
ncbi:MAG TPA: TlpA disulfide reductase family protein [Stellaceae bacterium]|jgi:thiol-disulfide isomerase/thioredoxin|nr:TlpA disulfide reductase family protein [Stellaceae bacterium]